ncbi:MAG: glycosyltransferase [Bacteroidales bacterium]|nr:glycosyltransferase [Bacteroidales bacterium]
MDITASIVIVSMNNTSCLFPCLDSIRKHTAVSYETLVVAYMFSEENLALLSRKYPWVTVIRSDELRGFAENNNLALEQAKGKYCFIVNDDTLMSMPVIDRLVADMEALDENTAAISPEIVFPDGRVQTCGRGPWTPCRYLRHYLHLVDETKQTRWTMQKGIFRTYTLNGACFLAKTDIFRQAGWFDPTYTFTPEDIALGTLFSRSGHPVYVDADVRITHIANATASRMEAAIKPTRVRGSLIFYSSLRNIRPNQGTEGCNRLTYTLMGAFIWCFEALRGLKYLLCDCSDRTPESRRNRIMREAAANVRRSIFTKRTTKEIFTDYYNLVRKR